MVRPSVRVCIYDLDDLDETSPGKIPPYLPTLDIQGPGSYVHPARWLFEPESISFSLSSRRRRRRP